MVVTALVRQRPAALAIAACLLGNTAVATGAAVEPVGRGVHARTVAAGLSDKTEVVAYTATAHTVAVEISCAALALAIGVHGAAPAFDALAAARGRARRAEPHRREAGNVRGGGRELGDRPKYDGSRGIMPGR